MAVVEAKEMATTATISSTARSGTLAVLDAQDALQGCAKASRQYCVFIPACCISAIR